VKIVYYFSLGGEEVVDMDGGDEGYDHKKLSMRHRSRLRIVSICRETGILKAR
jgi:hypothetical protein